MSVVNADQRAGEVRKVVNGQIAARTTGEPVTSSDSGVASGSASGSASGVTAITIARGDGIGPEIMDATLDVLRASGAKIEAEPIRIGREVYLSGLTSGIEQAGWDSLRRTRVFLKAPITTPQGGGYKSLNVTARKTLGLYANVRPAVAYSPFVATRHPGMDVVIIRENEEDTYGGVEHRQTPEVVQCLKLITRPGCERIVRYAFEYAVQNGRKKNTCMTKDNIMKQTDGLFRRVFEEVAAEYPQIQTDHMIIDIGTAKLACDPTRFDVIVTLNLYGDIISDVAAEVAGSVGLAPSANIGTGCAMFEAIHGSAPDIAGLGIANPSGLILSGVMMLHHIGQSETARLIHNAWLRTIEDGQHTRDITSTKTRQVLGTRDFAHAVIDRLGMKPTQLACVEETSASSAPSSAQKAQGSSASTQSHRSHEARPVAKGVDRKLVGVDVFVHWDESGRSPDVLAKKLGQIPAEGWTLKMITNRGVKVWPDGKPETWCSDHWRCRFIPADATAGGEVLPTNVIRLLGRLTAVGVDIIKTENLYTFDGVPGYSLGQGE
jgi:isocitrate dehydrogenase